MVARRAIKRNEIRCYLLTTDRTIRQTFLLEDDSDNYDDHDKELVYPK